MSASEVIRIALGEVGYLEKKSNYSLNEKTANAGTANYTKYGAWYGLNGQPWCDMFVSWCAEKAGESAAVGKYSYVPTHIAYFKALGRYHARGTYTPQPADIIFFRDSSHVGLVEKASGGYVHTIEGNTSGGSTLIANGGGVCKKCYSLSSAYIMGYGNPQYGGAGASEGDFETVKTWKNGGTEETVYADTGKQTKIGSLDPYESCDCLGTADGMYIVRYKVDGESRHKVGLVVYAGGVA